ncbi:MAG: M28 family peptidase [Pseudomonas sp.]|uniref:M28 family peptidase n=1 Tax=Pseudomonas sp. TaxID=306 RepID=UPI00339AC20C
MLSFKSVLRFLLTRLLAWGAVLLILLSLVTQPLVQTRPSTPPPVSSARLQAHVQRLSVDFHPRRYDQAENLRRTADYIAEAFGAAGAQPFRQPVSVGERAYENIVARFGPSSGPLMVIGAHYDSHGRTPGADDNASGVAGLLELARLLGEHPPSRPIELVAYTLEEPPYFMTEHMGSAWHARSLVDSQQNVQLMISLETIGYFSDAPASQRFPVPGMNLLYPDTGNFIGLVGKFSDWGDMRRAKAAMTGASDLPVHSINAPRWVEGIDYSDHLSYWDQGFSALMITDTAFNRNRDYHGREDTYEKLDYPRMAKVVQGVYAITQFF